MSNRRIFVAFLENMNFTLIYQYQILGISLIYQYQILGISL